MSLLNIGSIATDHIVTPYGEERNSLGGSAIYASIASSKMALTRIVGVVGDDMAEKFEEVLRKNHIDSKGLEVVEGKTFHWHGVYDNLNKAETRDTQLNVFAKFSPKIPDAYLDSDLVFLGNINPELQLLVLEKFYRKAFIAMDTMNFWIKNSYENLVKVLKRVDLLFINEDELKMLTHENNIFKAADKVFDFGLQYLVIKRGEYGSIFMDRYRDMFFVPVYPLREIIDPTGAGDSFAGGFMGYLDGHSKLCFSIFRSAMIYGTIAASYNIESFSFKNIQRKTLKNFNSRINELIKYMNMESN